MKGACEILGLDPLYVANEGKLLAIVASADVDLALKALSPHSLGKDSLGNPQAARLLYDFYPVRARNVHVICSVLTDRSRTIFAERCSVQFP